MPSTRHYLARIIPVPITLVSPESWRDQAKCARHPELPPSTWDDSIPDETDVQRKERIERAQAVCGDCPVAAQCFEDVDRRWDEGVRGGVDLRQLYRRGQRGAA